MESEPARVPGSAANGCAGNTVAFKSPTLLAWEMKPPGCGHRLESEWGSQGPEIRVLLLPQWRVDLPGGRPRLESGQRVTPWGSGPPLSALEGARPAATTGLEKPVQANPWGIDTLHLPLAATQPVKRPL
jgi:hypothetical protein